MSSDKRSSSAKSGITLDTCAPAVEEGEVAEEAADERIDDTVDETDTLLNEDLEETLTDEEALVVLEDSSDSELADEEPRLD